jgi:tetratricopeptide (TPR) repeat protein
LDGSIEFPLVNPDEITRDAWAAMARQDDEEALRLWKSLRHDFPERPDGHVWPIQILWQRGFLDEADAMASDAFARFPEHPDVLIQFAWIAMMRQRWDDALQWWTAVRERAPDRVDGYSWAARALWQAGRLDEAEIMATEAVRRFPDAPSALSEFAWVAVQQQNWQEAMFRWRRAYQADAGRVEVQTGLAQALRMTGRADEAEEIVTEALTQRPQDPDLLVEHAWTAVARNDWDAAQARLDLARANQTDPTRFEKSLGWIEYRIRSQGADAAGAVPPEADDVAPQSDPSAANLMLAFESLGERCDFGAVQRHYGVEPLGLLRFAFSRYEPLLAALEDRFAAVGTAADTGFELWQDETILVMKKYGIVFHTFVYQTELATPEKRDAFRQKQRRRLFFLKNKLVSDLEEPQKIWVYTNDERVADDDVLRLFAALRSYGPNSLLYVRPATADHSAGTVERLQDGLYAGYYTGLANFLGGEQPPFDLWRQLCERTYRLAHDGEQSAGDATHDRA